MSDTDRSELLSAVPFALVTVYFLSRGLSGAISGAPIEEWLAPLTIGALLVVVYGEHWYLQRVDGSIPDEPTWRTYVFLSAAFTGTILLGLWSRASGHDGSSWGTIVGVGAFGLALLAVGSVQSRSE